MTSDSQLERIYRRYGQSLFTHALTITGCRQSAEDVVHEAFSRLNHISMDGHDDPVAYVFVAVRNAAIDALRRENRLHQMNESIFNGFVPPRRQEYLTPSETLLTAERDRALRTAVQQLDQPYREAVVLKIYAGLTFKQISQIVGDPLKTVATRYRRALRQLEQKLRGQL